MNDASASIHSGDLSQRAVFIQTIKHFISLKTTKQFYSALPSIRQMLSKINYRIDQPVQFSDKYLKQLGTCLLSSPCVEPSQPKPIMETLMQLISVIIQLYAVSCKRVTILDTVKKLLDIDSPLLTVPKSKSYFWKTDENIRQITPFYHQCIQMIYGGLMRHVKIVWELPLKQILGLISFANSITLGTQKKIKYSQMIDLFYSQIHAFFLSGRPSLVEYAHQESLKQLCHLLTKRIYDDKSIEKVYFLGPILCETLIRSSNKQHFLVGIKLLDGFCFQASTFFSTIKPLTQKALQAWMNEKEIIELLISPQSSDKIIQASQNILKIFRFRTKNKKKVQFVLSVLSSQKPISKKLLKVLFAQLDCYYITDYDTKDLVYAHIAGLKDFKQMHFQYFQCLTDLLLKTEYLQSKQRAQKFLNLIVAIVKTGYSVWNDTYRRKGRQTLKRMVEKYSNYMKYQKKTEERVTGIKILVQQLLGQINNSNSLVFNTCFAEGEVWKALSNNSFQKIITDYAEENKLFDRIFDFLKRTPENKVDKSQFIRLIKFIVSKMNAKLDFTQDYLTVITKFPEIYQEMLSSTGYAHCQNQIKKIIALIKQQPETPFELFKLTFKKLNHSCYSESIRQPSIINPNIEEPCLKRNPVQLNFYEDLMNILHQTTSASLRRQISQFVGLLHLSYYQSGIYNPAEYLAKFLGELEDSLVKDCHSFEKNSITRETLLATLELVIQVIQITDIKGPGAYSPHSSLVSTSTVQITILNNITFGNDVEKVFHRNLPSNLVLFEALSIVGNAFKCGPQQIVLRQSGKLIPIIYNSRTLAELNLSRQDIIAEKNGANRVETPPIEESPGVFTQVFKRSITQIFNRFAYEGKMSLIECTNYVRQATASECLSSDRRVTEIMEYYDEDRDGIILLDDFLKYYKNNLTKYSSYYKDNILKGLFNLRYRKNLTLYNEPLDISSTYFLMFRYILSRHADCYPYLFRLARHQDQEVASRAQQLLLFLPSQPSNNQQLSRPIDFSSLTPFQRYYQLIYIAKQLGSTAQKRANIASFVAQRNDSIIFNLLGSLHSKSNSSALEKKQKIICLNILRNLIDVENLISLDLSQFIFSPIVMLPPTNFFQEQTGRALIAKDIVNFQTLLVLQLTQSQVNLPKIIDSCFHAQQEIRKIACNFVYIWQSKSQWKFNVFVVNIPQNNCEEWFELLCAIINNNPQIALTDLTSRIFKIILQKKQTLQLKFDKLLRGYLNMLRNILKAGNQVQQSQKFEVCLFSLLDKTLSPQNRKILYELLSMINKQKLLGYFGHMLQIVRPSQQCELRQNYLGIKNLGAICYINSIIQQFFMIDNFRQLILKTQIPQGCPAIQVNGNKIVDDFMYQLQKMFYLLSYSHKKYIIPAQFCYAYKDWDGQPINTRIQEDSHEFLNRLIQKVQEKLKKDGRIDQLQSILCGKTLTEIQCPQCKNRIDKVQSNYCFMMQVKGHESLQESLKKFNEKEEIEGYFCEKCNKKVAKITKRTFLNQLPEYVVLNLQRIIFDPKVNEKVKVHTRMTFPDNINFQEYIKNNNPTSKNEITNYRLKGVVIHTGTSEGGHYYSIIRTNQNQWYKFNDQSVVPFDQKQIPRECFGGVDNNDEWGVVTYSTNAYILFYQRQKMPSLHQISLQNQFTDQIFKENTTLIKQLQIHQQCFFQALFQLYQKLKSNLLSKAKKQEKMLEQNSQISLKEMLQVAHKAFMFLSVFNQVKPQVRISISSMISQLFQMMPQEALRFIQQLNIQTFLQNIMGHHDQSYRTSLKNIFIKAFTVCTKYYKFNYSQQNQQNHILVGVLRQLLSSLQSKLFYSNVSKTSAFLDLLDSLLRQNHSIKVLFVREHLMFRLFQLLVGKESSFMTFHPYVHDLPNHLFAPIFQIIVNLLPHKLNLVQASLSKDQTFCCETTSLQASIISNPRLYQKIIRLKYDNVLMGSLIAHYSFKDIQYSAMMADFFLTIINKKETIFEDEAVLLAKNLYAFLDIRDGLQKIRYGWILGIPQNKQGKQNQFCLDYSSRSQCINYVTGYYPKKGYQARSPLLQILYQEKVRDGALMIYGLKLILQLAESNEAMFDFLKQIPPATYLMKHYFQWLPDYLKTKNHQKDYILQHKKDLLTKIGTLYQLYVQKIKAIQHLLPVRKNIIGKTKQTQKIRQIQNKNYNLTISFLNTYVLDNQPSEGFNKSMPPQLFGSHEPKKYANAFVSYRAQLHYQKEAADIKIKPSLMKIKGKSYQKILLTLKDKSFNYRFLLQGDVNINFPFQDGPIDQILSINEWQQRQHQAVQVQLAQVYDISSVQKKSNSAIQEEKQNGGGAMPSEQPKLTCKQCTYDNEPTADICEICQFVLYS